MTIAARHGADLSDGAAEKLDMRATGHAGFLFRGAKTVYVDPYRLPDGSPKADAILLTHSHAGHCSFADVKKVARVDTVLVWPQETLGRFMLNQSMLLPGETKLVLGVPVTGVAAAVRNDGRHKPEAKWLGFVLEWNGVRVYHAGDADAAPGADVKADVALLPVCAGLMTPAEAVKAAKKVGAREAVPMHGGAPELVEEFRRLAAADGIDVRLVP
jgi:L-ascorbate metabolism protein UlaG (beta-lactamase superfamily)